MREREAAALGRRQKAVEETAREDDVVIDDQQPVGVTDRRGGQRGVGSVRPLAGLRLRGHEVERDVVPRARQLAAQSRHGPQVLRSHHPDDVHAPTGKRASRSRKREPRRNTAQLGPDVADCTDHQPSPAERSRAPGQVVRVGGVVRRRRRIERLSEPAERERGERDPDPAAAAHDVPQASEQRPQFGRQRRRVPAEHAVAARGAATVIRRPAERRQLRVAPRSPVVGTPAAAT